MLGCLASMVGCVKYRRNCIKIDPYGCKNGQGLNIRWMAAKVVVQVPVPALEL